MAKQEYGGQFWCNFGLCCQFLFNFHVIKEGDIVTIYKSQTFPTTGFGYVYNLAPELKNKKQRSLFQFSVGQAGLGKKRNGADNS